MPERDWWVLTLGLRGIVVVPYYEMTFLIILLSKMMSSFLSLPNSDLEIVIARGPKQSRLFQ